MFMFQMFYLLVYKAILSMCYQMQNVSIPVRKMCFPLPKTSYPLPKISYPLPKEVIQYRKNHIQYIYCNKTFFSSAENNIYSIKDDVSAINLIYHKSILIIICISYPVSKTCYHLENILHSAICYSVEKTC